MVYALIHCGIISIDSFVVVEFLLVLVFVFTAVSSIPHLPILLYPLLSGFLVEQAPHLWETAPSWVCPCWLGIRRGCLRHDLDINLLHIFIDILLVVHLTLLLKILAWTVLVLALRFPIPLEVLPNVYLLINKDVNLLASLDW